MFVFVVSAIFLLPVLAYLLVGRHLSPWATVTSNGPPYATGHVPVYYVCCLCNVGVLILWPNGWVDRDAQATLC